MPKTIINDPQLINTALISITIIFVVAIAAFTIIGGIAFKNTTKGAAKSFGLLFQRGNFLRIATVLIVVVAVIFLSLFGKLSEGAVAVLSGVAGYVLGGLEKGKDDDNKPEGEECG